MNKVLFYPYINVPDSSWFSKVLLYWDEVGSIIPYEFLEDPGKLTPHTRDLIKEQLVTQIIPSQYLWKVPDFKSAFIEYLLSKNETDLKNRRRAFEKGKTFRIHIEKMDGIERELIKMNLAEEINDVWYLVEQKTAKEFMLYLAATLGKHKELNFSPTTNDPDYLKIFKESSEPSLKLENKLEKLRIEILDDILPVPNHYIKPFKIKKFKEKHFNELRSFRSNVEKELITLADISDPELKKRRSKIFKEEAEDQINLIVELMNKSGFKKIIASNLGSAISLASGADLIGGIADAVINALKEDNFSTINPNFLYAAFAKEKL